MQELRIVVGGHGDQHIVNWRPPEQALSTTFMRLPTTPTESCEADSKVERIDQITYEDVSTILGSSLAEIKVKDRSRALRGAQILAQCLRLEGVDLLFCYPGGANLEIFDVLEDSGIRCIRVEHEQGAVHAAEGFARATGKVGRLFGDLRPWSDQFGCCCTRDIDEHRTWPIPSRQCEGLFDHNWNVFDVVDQKTFLRNWSGDGDNWNRINQQEAQTYILISLRLLVAIASRLNGSLIATNSVLRTSE